MNNDTFTTPTDGNNASKPKSKRIILIVIVTIVALGLIATATVFALPLLNSRSTAPPPVPTNPTGIRKNVDERENFQKNETAQFGHFEVKINKVTTDYKPDNNVTPQNTGYKFLVLNITAKNTDTDAHSLSDIDLAILNGEELINSTYSAPVEPIIKASSVAAGASVTGNLTYEIPPNAKDLWLYYNTQIYNEGAAKSKKIEYTLAF